VANIIGVGIVPTSKHPDPATRQAIQAAWARWTDDCDADGRSDFYGLEALAVRAMVESGEAFAQLLVTEAGLRIRLLDADMVVSDLTRELDGGARIVQGVELDPSGQRVAYHLRRH